jgi:hypothetical protein
MERMMRMSKLKLKLKVFISGPMSGYSDYNRHLFDQCQKDLEAAGFAVFNPAWLAVDEEGWSKGELMAIDICALSHCDAICFLDRWSSSNGSILESDFSDRMGLPQILYDEKGPRFTGLNQKGMMFLTNIKGE